LINPINIADSKAKVSLNSGVYSIYVLGGWGVKLGDFSITFKNVESNQLVNSYRPIIALDTMAYNIWAKKIFNINVPEAGDYEIIFKNPKSIRVYRFNWGLLTSVFQSIPNSEIRILISDNNGMLMFKE